MSLRSWPDDDGMIAKGYQDHIENIVFHAKKGIFRNAPYYFVSSCSIPIILPEAIITSYQNFSIEKETNVSCFMFNRAARPMIIQGRKKSPLTPSVTA